MIKKLIFLTESNILPRLLKKLSAGMHLRCIEFKHYDTTQDIFSVRLKRSQREKRMN